VNRHHVVLVVFTHGVRMANHANLVTVVVTGKSSGLSDASSPSRTRGLSRSIKNGQELE
jgi:hypothetical protein